MLLRTVGPFRFKEDVNAWGWTYRRFVLCPRDMEEHFPSLFDREGSFKFEIHDCKAKDRIEITVDSYGECYEHSDWLGLSYIIENYIIRYLPDKFYVGIKKGK